jgi:hypothetical protein
MNILKFSQTSQNLSEGTKVPRENGWWTLYKTIWVKVISFPGNFIGVTLFAWSDLLPLFRCLETINA